MRRRDTLGSLSSRVRAGQDPQPAFDDGAKLPTGAHETVPAPWNVPGIKPCWVTDQHGHLPGLLLEWRRVASGFQGRVVRLVQDETGWVIVVEWLPAELLGPGAPAS